MLDVLFFLSSFALHFLRLDKGRDEVHIGYSTWNIFDNNLCRATSSNDENSPTARGNNNIYFCIAFFVPRTNLVLHGLIDMAQRPEQAFIKRFQRNVNITGNTWTPDNKGTSFVLVLNFHSLISSLDAEIAICFTVVCTD